MQVLRGSHKLGRVEHGKFGDQTGADPERVENAKKLMDLVYVELAPGDVLFFHSNTLHASDQNKSEHPRWSFICCYNTRHNNPYKASHHPFYEKLEKVPDSRLKEMGAQLDKESADPARQSEAATDFWRPDQDKSLAGGGKTIQTK
jgi:ectoine hydroxylase